METGQSLNGTEMDWHRSALVIIDMQHDFVQPDGASPIAGTDDIVDRLAQLADVFRKHGRPVIHIVRLYATDGSNVDLCRRAQIRNGLRVVPPYSEGAGIVSALLPDGIPQPDADLLMSGAAVPLGRLDTAFYKPRWGAFYQTQLHDFLHLQGVDSLVIAGCNFPNCPRTTIYEASERDYRLAIVPDLLSGIYEKGISELRNIGVNMMTAPQIEDALTTL